MSRRLARLVLWSSPVLLAAGLYAATLGHGFIWDDKFLILENRYLRDWSELGRNLGSDFFRKTRDTSKIGYWRPVVTLSYMLDRTAFDDRPWGFHLENVVLHALASVLVGILARRLGLRARSAWIAAMLFAAHPVHVESVAWIAGRTDLYCTVFALSALGLELSHAARPHWARRWGATLAGALALLSKEMAAVLPALVALRAWWLPGPAEAGRPLPRRMAKAVLPHALVLGAYALVRFGVLGVATHTPGWAEQVGRTVLFWTWWAALVEYLRVLVWPALLSVAIELPHLRGPASPWVAAGVVLLAGLLGVAWRARVRAPALAFAVGLLLVGLVPLTNFVMPINAPVTSPFAWAERFLYLPSVGFCLALGWLLGEALPRRLAGAGSGTARWSVGSVVLVALVAASLRTVARVRDWRDDLSLFGSAVRAAPDAVLARLNYAVALADRGRLDEAEREYRRVLEQAPFEYRAHYNLGNVYRLRGELERAEAAYREALRLQPEHAQSLLNLGLVLYSRGRLEEALAAFSEADRLLPGHLEAKINRANVLQLLGRTEEALALYREALQIETSSGPARVGLAQALFKLGRREEGLREAREALRLQPDLPQAHLLLGIELDREGRRAEAEAHYRELLRLEPDNLKVRRRLRLDAPEESATTPDARDAGREAPGAPAPPAADPPPR